MIKSNEDGTRPTCLEVIVTAVVMALVVGVVIHKLVERFGTL